MGRDQKTKHLGLAMGKPIPRVRDHVHRQQLKALLANFGLYGDGSGHVASLLHELFQIEVYSIDELFVCFEALSKLSNSASLPRLVGG
ncbi:hypothetical protein [Xanthomonas campestris]|uniref:Y-family DNA polymerase n=1 Tax=Xanthomonas campestris TaxID=339 RepID=UPI002B222E21|nr:hypothetical protein [Xanthomonas campestris]MEA9931470.1 hypothetical protein [Xanthomonas campestris pv. raphani]